MAILAEGVPIVAGADWNSEICSEFLANEMNGRVGQDLLSENDQVRVWRISIAPGERVPFHRHVLNYFWVAITPGTSRSRSATGETDDMSYDAGTVRFYEFERGEFMLHDLENIGDTDLIFTTVEFKNSANDPLPL